jgi:CBS domain-containing protein
MTTCGEIMTRNIVCCMASESIDRVAKLMKDNDVGPIPVVEDMNSKKLVGIVTDRDLVVKVLAEGRDIRTTRVGDVMSRELVTCREDDKLKKAITAMEEHQVRRIPVVNGSNQIIGIIAQADIALQEKPKKAAELVEEISKPDKAESSKS